MLISSGLCWHERDRGAFLLFYQEVNSVDGFFLPVLESTLTHFFTFSKALHFAFSNLVFRPPLYLIFSYMVCGMCVTYLFLLLFATPKMGFDHLLSLLYHLQLITVELLINLGPLVSSYASLLSCNYSSCVLLSVANSFFSYCFPLTLHLPEAVTLLSMTKVVSLVPDLIMVNRATNCSI